MLFTNSNNYSKIRNTNIEIYRIIVMLFIVAHLTWLILD